MSRFLVVVFLVCLFAFDVEAARNKGKKGGKNKCNRPDLDPSCDFWLANGYPCSNNWTKKNCRQTCCQAKKQKPPSATTPPTDEPPSTQTPPANEPPSTQQSGYNPTWTKEVQAFAEWVGEWSRAKTVGCPDALKGHYAPDATFTAQAGGQALQKIENDGPAIEQFVCTLFEVTAEPSPGLLSVEHCNGVWRGALAAMLDAKNNPLGESAIPGLMQPRNFIIKGRITEEGKFQAQEDLTCVGGCVLDYEWAC